jgi:hypothetical protein
VLHYQGAKCLANIKADPKIKEELKCFAFLTRQAILCHKDKELCFRRTSANGTPNELGKCSNAWKYWVSVACKSVLGDKGKDPGHAPDTCAGGMPQFPVPGVMKDWVRKRVT